MEPERGGRRHNVVLVDTFDIHAFGAALHRHADDLASVAAHLTAARVSGDAFGSVGSGFVASLNDALIREAGQVEQLAGRILDAKSAAAATVASYHLAEDTAGQRLSTAGA